MGTVDRLIICLAVRLKSVFFFFFVFFFLSFLSLSVQSNWMRECRAYTFKSLHSFVVNVLMLQAPRTHAHSRIAHSIHVGMKSDEMHVRDLCLPQFSLAFIWTLELRPLSNQVIWSDFKQFATDRWLNDENLERCRQPWLISPFDFWRVKVQQQCWSSPAILNRRSLS